jgi:unsaturated rhamnogalacturonyl hydrolase
MSGYDRKKTVVVMASVLMFGGWLSSAQGDAAAKRLVVGLDCFHNNETKPHYVWDNKNSAQFSQLGDVVTGFGATLASLKEPITKDSLAPFSVFIIVDPDTTEESLKPEYFTAAEADALEAWVKKGGVLLLLGNDKGNMEFPHFNEVAKRFGIIFNEDTVGKSKLEPEWKVDFMQGVKKVNIVKMCSLTVTPPAIAAMTCNNQVLMAMASVGEGRVLAVGDPWFYNEHINDEENLIAAKKMFTWLLGIK